MYIIIIITIIIKHVTGTGVVLRSSHGIITSCSEVKLKSERLFLETMNTLQIEDGSLGFIETLHKQ